jgi:hypothetical protein
MSIKKKEKQMVLTEKNRKSIGTLHNENQYGISINGNILIDLGLEFMSMASSGNEEFTEIVKSKFEAINKK